MTYGPMMSRDGRSVGGGGFSVQRSAAVENIVGSNPTGVFSFSFSFSLLCSYSATKLFPKREKRRLRKNSLGGRKRINNVLLYSCRVSRTC